MPDQGSMLPYLIFVPTAAAAQSPAAAAAVDCQSTPCSGSEHLDLASLLQGLSDALYEVARKASDPVFKASAAKRGSATQAQANADSQDSDWISIQVVKRILTCGIELDAARCRKLGQECKLSLALWTDLVSGLTMQGAAVGEEEVLWQLGRSRSDA